MDIGTRLQNYKDKHNNNNSYTYFKVIFYLFIYDI